MADVSQQAQELIRQQEEANKRTAELAAQFGFIGQQTPFGTSEFTRTPEGGFIRRETLSPEQQRILEQQQGLEGTRNQLISALLGQVDTSGLSLGGLQELPGSEEDFGAQRQRIEGELFQRQADRLAPIFQQQKERLVQDLAGRGIPLGSAQFQEQIRQLEQRQNDALLDVQSRAIELGGGEQARLQGFAGQQFGQGLQTRQQQLQEQLLQRQLPVDIAGALLGQQSGFTQPQFLSPAAITPQGVNTSEPFLNLQNLEQQSSLTRRNQDLERQRLAQQASQFGQTLGQRQFEFGKNFLNNQEQFEANRQRTPSLVQQGASALVGAGLGAFGESFGEKVGTSGFRSALASLGFG